MKGKDYENYQRLNKEIRNDCKKAKDGWFNHQYTEIEILEKQFFKLELGKCRRKSNKPHAKTGVVAVLGVSKIKMGTAYLAKKREHKDG